MTKSISTALTTHINSDVTTLATCIEIVRADYNTIRLTNHDTDLSVDGDTYDHSIPFIISANSSSSTLSTDNTELQLFADETTFLKEDFSRGLYKHAECKIFLVDYTSPDTGEMIVREGWFGPIVVNEQNVIKITVAGLMKILDFEVGRTYQPMCDADLGDSRCKVAIDHGQAWSELNPAVIGDWVYAHDLTTMTDVSTLTNDSFEDDGTVSEGGTITGWTTFGEDSFTPEWAVAANWNGGLDALDSSYALWGNNGAGSGGSSADESVQGIRQEVDLTSGGMTDTIIDEGRYFIFFAVAAGHPTAVEDNFNVVVECLDSSGTVLRREDEGLRLLETLDPDVAEDEWREIIYCFPLPANSRTFRIELYAQRLNGEFFNVGFDRVRLKFWDFTTTTPYSDAIHKAVRMVEFDDSTEFPARNGSFEADGVVANTNTDGSVTNWTFLSTGDYWSVVEDADVTGSVPDLDYALYSGDSGSASQETYEITQVIDLENDVGLDTSNIDLGRYVFRFNATSIHEDASLSDARIDLDFQDGTFTTVNLLSEDWYTNTAGVQETKELQQTIAATTRYIEIKLSARSPSGVSQAEIGWDRIRMWFMDAELPGENDSVRAFGSSSTTFSTTADTYTVDGNILWKAKTVKQEFDVVLDVDSSDSQKFTGTNIAGSSGQYEISEILWLSGDNTGQKNIIRTWDDSTQEIRLYFQPINDIQVGDRFMYNTPCHKRFTEDCITDFDNAINFRGFPHLPGKLSDT